MTCNDWGSFHGDGSLLIESSCLNSNWYCNRTRVFFISFDNAWPHRIHIFPILCSGTTERCLTCRYAAENFGTDLLWDVRLAGCEFIVSFLQRATLLGQRFRGSVAAGTTASTPTSSSGHTLSRTELEQQAYEVLLSLTSWTAVLGSDTGISKRRTAAPLLSGTDAESESQYGRGVAVTIGRPATIVTTARDAALHVTALGVSPASTPLFVRCSHCRTSLSLPALLDGSAASVEWLSAQRPHMLSCPQCRRTLPVW
jgi:hypothetical protein